MKSFLRGVFSTAVGVFFGSLLFMIIVPLTLILIFKGAGRASFEPISDKSILHLKMHGSLVERRQPLEFDFEFNYLSGRSLLPEDHSIGLYEVTKAIDLAAKDPRISGIVLELKQLEAGWAGVKALHRSLEDFKASGKWIYAYGERLDEMTYYLATTANRILMQPYGEIEFNGLAVDMPFVKGLFEKLELEPRIFRVGKFKAAIEPLTRDSMSEENRLQTQSLNEDLWKNLRQAVAKANKLSEERVDAIAANLEVVSAADALKAGMVHELAFEDEVEDKLKEMTVGEDEDLLLITAGRLLRDHDRNPLGGRKSKSGAQKIAVIFADGEIVASQGGRDRVAADELRADIVEAAEDPDVAAIVLRVNSPGGDALASDVIWRELRITDDEIPVVVSMGDVAASGGYYIASAGRYIFAESTTITGSIGVFGILFGTEKFFKNKAGVNFDRVVTHPFADLGNPNRPIRDLETKSIQMQVERVYKRFLDVVEQGRGYEKRADLESIAEGRVWSGSKAKELGLVDELGGLQQAIVKAAEFAELKDYEVEIMPESRDPIRAFFERISGDAVETWLGPGVARVLRLAERAEKSFGPALELKNTVQARLLYDLRIR